MVAPANGRNLVYFKWTVPADSASVTFYCKGTINYENAGKEQDSANNSIEYAVISQRKTVSQTPDTRYEKNPPAGYVSNVTPPTTNAGSATWNMWEYENDKLVLKSYGITVGNANPTITPGSGCSTAERVGSTWKMKSGYGITLLWNPSLVAKPGYIMPDSDAYTSAQDVYTEITPIMRKNLLRSLHSSVPVLKDAGRKTRDFLGFSSFFAVFLTFSKFDFKQK